jgi:lipopolysaccharide transport system permease protein
VIPFGVQLWFYLTPVIYPTGILPDSLAVFYQLNPMVGVVECFRAIVLGTPLPYVQWLTSLLVGAVVFTTGLLYFSKVERTFADVA